MMEVDMSLLTLFVVLTIINVILNTARTISGYSKPMMNRSVFSIKSVLANSAKTMNITSGKNSLQKNSGLPQRNVLSPIPIRLFLMMSKAIISYPQG